MAALWLCVLFAALSQACFTGAQRGDEDYLARPVATRHDAVASLDTGHHHDDSSSLCFKQCESNNLPPLTTAHPDFNLGFGALWLSYLLPAVLLLSCSPVAPPLRIPLPGGRRLPAMIRYHRFNN